MRFKNLMFWSILFQAIILEINLATKIRTWCDKLLDYILISSRKTALLWSKGLSLTHLRTFKIPSIFGIKRISLIKSEFWIKLRKLVWRVEVKSRKSLQNCIKIFIHTDIPLNCSNFFSVQEGGKMYLEY